MALDLLRELTIVVLLGGVGREQGTGGQVGGRIVGFATVLLSLLFVVPAHSGHLNTGCGTVMWTEAVREDNTRDEDGVHGLVEIEYPSGGPVDSGGLVRSLFGWKNFDNFAEVGWLWRDGFESQPTRFTFWIDAGQPKIAKKGPAGDLGTFHQYRLNNDVATHWIFRADGETINEHTFVNLGANGEGVLPWGNSEVDNSCDSAKAHFKNLKQKNCNTCEWVDWTSTENYSIGNENPCYHTDLYSNTAFRIVHGAGAGETCQ